MIIEPPTMIDNTKQAAGKLEPQHGSKYNSVLKKLLFQYSGIPHRLRKGREQDTKKLTEFGTSDENAKY